jgi:hypothetical protein
LTETVLSWSFENTNEVLLKLFNVLSPEAMRKRAKLAEVDPGNPLARGLASKLRIIGGEIVYEDHVSDHPLLKIESINGLRLPVTGGSVRRTQDGRIVGHVDVAEVAPLMRELNAAMGVTNGYDFFSATEYLSEDPENPSIFQNLVRNTIPAGTPIAVPGLGKIPAPFEMSCSAFTEAVGFVENDRFMGTIRLSYEFSFTKIQPHIRLALEARMGKIPTNAQMEGSGRFDVTLLADV